MKSVFSQRSAINHKDVQVRERQFRRRKERDESLRQGMIGTSGTSAELLMVLQNLMNNFQGTKRKIDVERCSKMGQFLHNKYRRGTKMRLDG